MEIIKASRKGKRSHKRAEKQDGTRSFDCNTGGQKVM